MINIGNFNKNSYISVISIAKPQNFVVFAYTCVSRSQELFIGDFCMNLFFVDSDEARHWSVKRFIASSLQIFT